MELTEWNPYEEEGMEVEDDEGDNEATEGGDACTNGVGEIDGDKGKNDDAVEGSNDSNDDASSLIVFVVTGAVADIIADEDCTWAWDDEWCEGEPVDVYLSQW